MLSTWRLGAFVCKEFVHRVFAAKFHLVVFFDFLLHINQISCFILKFVLKES